MAYHFVYLSNPYPYILIWILCSQMVTAGESQPSILFVPFIYSISLNLDHQNRRLYDCTAKGECIQSISGYIYIYIFAGKWSKPIIECSTVKWNMDPLLLCYTHVKDLDHSFSIRRLLCKLTDFILFNHNHPF
jgi:hypothetical protein